MNRLASGLLALVLAVVPFPASGQSMADAAAKERERRERQRKAGQTPKVFTNDDLSKGEAAASGSSGSAAAGAAPSSPSGSQRSEQPSASATRGPEEGVSRADQESSWRGEAAATRKVIADAEARVKQAEQQLEEISGRIRLSTDTNEILRLADQKQAADRAVADARANVEAARAGLADFEERARRAGVPPGWIR